MSAFHAPLPRTPYTYGGPAPATQQSSSDPTLRAEDFYQSVEDTDRSYQHQSYEHSPLVASAYHNADLRAPTSAYASGSPSGSPSLSGHSAELGKMGSLMQDIQSSLDMGDTNGTSADERWLGTPQYDSRGRPVSVATGIIGMYASSGSEDESSYTSNSQYETLADDRGPYGLTSQYQPASSNVSKRLSRPLPPPPVVPSNGAANMYSGSIGNSYGDGSISETPNGSIRSLSKANGESSPWMSGNATLPPIGSHSFANTGSNAGSAARQSPRQSPRHSPSSSLAHNANGDAQRNRMSSAERDFHAQQKGSVGRARAPLPTPPSVLPATRQAAVDGYNDLSATMNSQQSSARSSASTGPHGGSGPADDGGRLALHFSAQTQLQGPPQIIEQRPSPEFHGRALDEHGYPREEKSSAYTFITSPYGTVRTPLPNLQPSQGSYDQPYSSILGGSSLLSPNSSSGQAQGSSSYMSTQLTNLTTEASTMNSTEYVNFALLSNLAVLLRDAVPRGEQIKGSVAYPGSFTGRDVVSSLQALIPGEVAAAAMGHGANVRPQGEAVDMMKSRHIALLIAKSLKSQLFFHEVDWGEGDLRDGVEDVYMFLGDTLNISDTNMNGILSSGTSHGQQAQFDDGSADWISPASRHNDSMTRVRPKTLMPASSAATDLDELPTGVFTPLTTCYSPLCGKPGAPPRSECYSASCPRARVSTLRRNISATGSQFRGAGSGATTPLPEDPSRVNARAWAETVPKELLESLPKKEIDRQNAIHETIQKEEEYLADLELLEELFVKGLERPSATGDPPPIPIGPYRDSFLQEVFLNHRLLASHIRALVERLHIRQREQGPVIQSVGDIFLDVALDWGEVYHDYIVNFPLAKSRVKREVQINPKFKAFLEACRRNPLSHRHELESFLIRPTTRMMRYLLHLESILKKTDQDNEDRESLVRAMEIIDDQLKSAQAGVPATDIKVAIRDYAWGLATKRNKAAVDMDLLDPERQLVHQGEVFRKPKSTEFEWTDLHAVLFDNYFIVTKSAKGPEGENDIQQPRYVLAKPPIPVEMLELLSFNEPSLSRSIGLSSFHIRSNAEQTRELWPFTVNHIGGKFEHLTLYTSTKAAREEWRAKFEEARGLRAAVQEASKVFESHILSDSVFALPSALSIDPDRPPPGVDSSVFHGRVTCAVPFATSDGRRLVAIGCADGVWIGLRHDARSLRRVLHLKQVTQCAVLEAFGIFVVLADKVLISYSLEVLVPSGKGTGPSSTPERPQKLSGKSDVIFFSVGVLKERTLLVYMKKRTNESVFHALEPVMSAPRAEHGRSAGNFFGKFHKDSKTEEVFRMYKSFFIPSDAYTMQFLKAKLCIVCARGFEIMNLDSLRPGTIPDFSHCPRDDHRIQVLAKRVETAKPLGMFKSSDSEFLLCYNDFACYVDRVGEPIRLDNVIEWEGRPYSVAFESPYVLAFDSHFVEVRDCTTGRLVQIVRGTDIRYVSGSGTVAATNAGRTDGTGNADASDGSIIITQRRRPLGRMSAAFDYQAVVELVPSYPRSPPNLSHSNTVSSRAGWI